MAGHDSFEAVSKSIADLPGIAKQLLKFSRGHKIWTLNGDLGAGKTSLVKELGNLIGVIDEINSPTFPIVNEYSNGIEVIYHIDCYRLKSLPEAIDAGLEELLSTDSYCFIEWPEVIREIIFGSRIDVLLSHAADHQQRILTAQIHE